MLLVVAARKVREVPAGERLALFAFPARKPLGLAPVRGGHADTLTPESDFRLRRPRPRCSRVWRTDELRDSRSRLSACSETVCGK